MQYRVKQGTLQLPKAEGKRGLKLAQGAALPEGALPAEEIARLAKAGVLELLTAAPAEAQADGLGPRKGKWNHDPADLAGRALEDLLLLVADTDPEHPVLHGAGELGEGDLVRILTADFDPVFRSEVARSADRTRIEPEQAEELRAKVAR